MLEDDRMRELVRRYISQQVEEYETTLQFAVDAELATPWSDVRNETQMPAQILEGFFQTYDRLEDRFDSNL